MIYTKIVMKLNYVKLISSQYGLNGAQFIVIFFFNSLCVKSNFLRWNLAPKICTKDSCTQEFLYFF